VIHLVFLLQQLPKKPSLVQVNAGEAFAALSAFQLTSSFGCTSLCLEGDLLTVILAVNKASLLTDWNFAPIIGDIH
jgi:hypothetical protein